MENHSIKTLLVNASARQQDSVTRRFANELINALQAQHGELLIQERDVSQGMPIIDEQWINANFTPGEQRTEEQKAALSHSDLLVNELKQSDVIIIAAPVYNFSIPASLKAWIDQIARVGLTFNYSAHGPVGKLTGKKAYIVMATGGTVLGSDIDFASGYLRHVLGFIGIDNVSIVAVERFNQNDEQGLQNIRAQIEQVSRLVA